MPRLDGTRPYSSGKPGKGLGPCERNYRNGGNGLRIQHHLHQHRRQRLYQQVNFNQDAMYEFTEEELNKRKQALQKELQWLNERINEMGTSNENSNSSN